MVSKERAQHIPGFPLRKLKGDLRMKTLKKTLALLLAVAMLLAMTACGGNAPAAPETEPKQEETAPVVEEPVAAAPVISVTEESEVVQAQQASTAVNVLNGLTFTPADDAQKAEDAKAPLPYFCG